jgi:cold shock CspA family protein
MGRSQETYSKREKEKKRLKQRKEKQERKEERKANAQGGGDLESMMAYVDEFGNITDTPPDPTKKKKIDASSIELGIPKKEKEVFNPNREGKVEFFNHSKGFGFIRDAENQEKYFVHVNGTLEDIDENDKVSYELEKGAKGMNAVNVKKV